MTRLRGTGVARSCILILRIIPGLENRVKGPQIITW
jgi:hypothetical protein